MATQDAFTSQILALVRRMPDDAILALVKNQLGALIGGAAGAALAPKRGRKPGRPAKAKAAAPAPAPTPKPKAKAKAKSKKPAVKAAKAPSAVKAAPKVAKASPKKAGGRIRRSGAELQKALEIVERAVKNSKGVAVGQVVKATGMKKASVAAALKELRSGRRIFLAGDRRFARYAGDARTAEAASSAARKSGK